jgi:hypothetical protein
MSAGMRGNNPCLQQHREVTIDPAGPDGWEAMTDRIAFGQEPDTHPGRPPGKHVTLASRPAPRGWS